MRLILNTIQRTSYFNQIKKKANLSWKAISKEANANLRVLNDWKIGKYSIPMKFCLAIESKYGVRFPANPIYKSEYSHAQAAGRKGALNRYIIYGNLGTKEGRIKGGFQSLITHKNQLTPFYNIKNVEKPAHSINLAEAIGILIGDGCITPYQVRVSLDMKRDLLYTPYVTNLFENLFKVRGVIQNRSKETVTNIVFSSVNLVKTLAEFGLCTGDKIINKVTIPQWIIKNAKFSRACIRGIFDTDGCVYLDEHKIKNLTYRSINVALTSYSFPLLVAIKNILLKNNLHPTLTSKWSVRIRKRNEVIKFFDIIGSNNPKNIEKYRTFNSK